MPEEKTMADILASIRRMAGEPSAAESDDSAGRYAAAGDLDDAFGARAIEELVGSGDWAQADRETQLDTLTAALLEVERGRVRRQAGAQSDDEADAFGGVGEEQSAEPAQPEPAPEQEWSSFRRIMETANESLRHSGGRLRRAPVLPGVDYRQRPSADDEVVFEEEPEAQAVERSAAEAADVADAAAAGDADAHELAAPQLQELAAADDEADIEAPTQAPTEDVAEIESEGQDAHKVAAHEEPPAPQDAAPPAQEVDPAAPIDTAPPQTASADEKPEDVDARNFADPRNGPTDEHRRRMKAIRERVMRASEKRRAEPPQPPKPPSGEWAALLPPPARRIGPPRSIEPVIDAEVAPEPQAAPEPAPARDQPAPPAISVTPAPAPEPEPAPPPPAAEPVQAAVAPAPAQPIPGASMAMAAAPPETPRSGEPATDDPFSDEFERLLRENLKELLGEVVRDEVKRRLRRRG